MRWTQADKRSWQDLLRSIRDAITATGRATEEAITKQTKAAEEAAKQRPPQPLSRITVDIQIPREETDRYYAEQHNSQRLQWWTFSATIATFVAVTAYAFITYLQWCTMDKTYKEIQKQTTVLTQQLEGTRAAIVDFQVQIIKDTMLQMTAINNGPMTAKDVHMRCTVAQKKPRQIIIGMGDQIPAYEFYWPEIAAGDQKAEFRTIQGTIENLQNVCCKRLHTNGPGVTTTDSTTS